jgi:O-antigen/teichoic acid export membrane protein
LAIVGGNSTSALLGAVGGILVARFIDPETAGDFRSYTIPLMYLTFLHLGTFDGLNRQIPLHLGQDRRDLVEAVASSAGAWNLLLSVSVSVVFLLLSAWSLAHGNVHGMLGWAAQALVAWWVFYGGFLGATYRTIDHFVAVARVQTFQSLLSFALVFILPALGFIGLCLRSAFPSVVATWLLHRGRPLKMPPSLRREPLIDLIRVGLPFCFWGSLYTSLWGAIENTLMLALGGAKGLGLFAVAVMLREGICILPQAIHQVLTPHIVQAYGREGRLGSAHGFVYQLVPPLVIGTTVIVLVLSYALDTLVPMLVPKYSEGLPLMKVSLWVGVVQAFALPLNALIASGKSWNFGRGILAGIVTFPIVTYLLTPFTGGMLAVAGGSLAGKVMRTGLGYWELRLLSRHEAP